MDPDPEALLPVAASVATEHPELAVFAISARADGELILVALLDRMLRLRSRKVADLGLIRAPFLGGINTRGERSFLCFSTAS